MTLGMLTGPVAGGVVEDGRRRPAAEGAVVPDIGLDAARHRLALGQDRHRGVVPVQALGGQRETDPATLLFIPTIVVNRL